MSFTRWSAIVACATLALGGCAPVRPMPSPSLTPAVSDFVVVANGTGLAGFDFARGAMAYQAPSAVASPDWTGLLSADSQHLSVIDPRNGALQRTIPLQDGLVPTTVSAAGSRVALAEPAESNVWPPANRDHSRIVVADTTGAHAPLTFDLDGNYQPDAFSSDGRRLFVLEYQPPTAPDSYRVRVLDLNTGVVSGLLSRFKVPVPEESMRGTRQAHVLSPDRHVLYTLYTNQPDHLHSRDLAAGLTQSSGDAYAFVHVLNLLEGWAYCLDLPQPFGVGPASAETLALSLDGRWLYVADRSSGAVAVADANQLIVRSVVNIGADPVSSTASAAVGRDNNLYLGAASNVLVIDRSSLALQKQFALASTPNGLAVSSDGRRLFVTTDSQLIALDAASGSQLSAISATGLRGIVHVNP